MDIATLELKTTEAGGHLTTAAITELGGNLLSSDSYGRELWDFGGEMAQRTTPEYGEEYFDDDWTADPRHMAGWFPDDEPGTWVPLLMD